MKAVHTQGTHGQFSGAMDEMSQKVQKMRAPTHVYTRHTVNSVGQWMKVQGKFKMQGHSRSGVVMDIAAFKVSHSVVIDRDATTLQAEKARSALMERYTKASTHHSCRVGVDV